MNPRRQPYQAMWAIAAAVIGAATIALLSLSSTETSAMSGTVSGQAYAASGSGIPGPVSSVALPPGGDTGGSISSSGPFQVSGSSSNSCSGAPSLDASSATCVATIDNFSVSLAGVPIITATQIRSQSNSAAGPDGATSDSAGSQVSGLCVVPAPLLPCSPIDGPATMPFSLPAGGSGSLTVLQQAARSAQDGVAGSGLTTRGMHLEMAIPGAGSYATDFAVADTFVSDLASELSQPQASQVPGLPELPAPVPPLPELPLPALPGDPVPGAPEPPVPLPALPAPPVPLPALPVPLPPGLPIPGAPGSDPAPPAAAPEVPPAAPPPAPPAGQEAGGKAGPSALPNAGNFGDPFSPGTAIATGVLGIIAAAGAVLRIFARRL